MRWHRWRYLLPFHSLVKGALSLMMKHRHDPACLESEVSGTKANTPHDFSSPPLTLLYYIRIQSLSTNIKENKKAIRQKTDNLSGHCIQVTFNILLLASVYFYWINYIFIRSHQFVGRHNYMMYIYKHNMLFSLYQIPSKND